MTHPDISANSRVVIVGASVGGLSTAEALRAEGFRGPITLIGEEVHLPYGRPPLSKQVLAGLWPPARTTLRTEDELHDLQIEVLSGRRAIRADLDGRVILHDGSGGPAVAAFDVLVIATGLIPRTFSMACDSNRVHTLRTIDDVAVLRNQLDGSDSAVVLGSGVLGSEIAAGLRKRGLSTTLAGRSSRLELGQVGGLLSDRLEGLHHDNGVTLQLGREAIGISHDRDRISIDFADGGTLSTELVVAAIGSEPAVQWLCGSGLDLSDGVVCDPNGRAAPGVYAVGDVALWRSSPGDLTRRAEHQSNAIEQGISVARMLMTGQTSPPVIPFFWSELYGCRIQAYGHFNRHLPLAVLAGSPVDGAFVAASKNGHVATGIVGWNMPREFRHYRRLVGHGDVANGSDTALVGAAKGAPS